MVMSLPHEYQLSSSTPNTDPPVFTITTWRQSSKADTKTNQGFLRMPEKKLYSPSILRMQNWLASVCRTIMLKEMVRLKASSSAYRSWKMVVDMAVTTMREVVWKRLWVTMFFFMISPTRGASSLMGLRFSSVSDAESDANASAPNVSCTRLSQRDCSRVSGSVFMKSTTCTMRNMTKTAVMQIWNWMNLQAASRMLRPHLMPVTQLEKLSSVSTTSATSIAACCPPPIATPTFALFIAAMSFTPSPVTATTWRSLWMSRRPLSYSWEPMSPLTRRYLSMGEERASTRSVGQIWSKAIWSKAPSASSGLSESTVLLTILRKRGPSKMASVGGLRGSRPHSLATATAVDLLSPVTMMTLTPARLQSRSALGTSARTGSWMKAKPRRVRSSSGDPSGLPALRPLARGHCSRLREGGISRKAMAIPRIAFSEAMEMNCFFLALVRSTTLPSRST
mmetsp:Transcript_26382/g.57289  ORF Transcript_26382/g.57289 Transcript_26382/m.57289 type:complete len:451 (-) Transcript_26382:1837-3189(-)